MSKVKKDQSKVIYSKECPLLEAKSATPPAFD